LVANPFGLIVISEVKLIASWFECIRQLPQK